MECKFFIKQNGKEIPLECLEDKKLKGLLNYLDLCAIKSKAREKNADIMEIKPILKNIL